MGILDKMKKTGSIKGTGLLSESKLLNNRDCVHLDVPILNVAFSAAIDTGYSTGIHLVAGPSRHFKSNICMVMVNAYLKKYEDSVCVFYDSEFGTTKDYWKANGIDPDKVIHVPITDIEELKFDIMKKLESIERGERVVFFIDSLGNLASKKEVEDSLSEKSAADMTRAKQLKSLFRMVTPYFTIKDIPMFAIQHTYKSQDMYPKDIVSGGTGGMLSSNSVFIMGRSQEKDGDEIAGWNFTMNVEKSRLVKEKSKIPILVTYEGGINKYSGLMELALESGHVVKPKNGWYARVNQETAEIMEPNLRLKQTYSDDFWNPILNDPDFKEFVRKKYSVAYSGINDGLDSAIEALDDDEED